MINDFNAGMIFKYKTASTKNLTPCTQSNNRIRREGRHTPQQQNNKQLCPAAAWTWPFGNFVEHGLHYKICSYAHQYFKTLCLFQRFPRKQKMGTAVMRQCFFHGNHYSIVYVVADTIRHMSSGSAITTRKRTSSIICRQHPIDTTRRIHDPTLRRTCRQRDRSSSLGAAVDAHTH